VSHARHLFETVHPLTDTGRAYNSVARELGLHWRTVRKYATAASWQECVRRPRLRAPSPLDRYLQYLQQRWDEGEHSAKVLHEELKAKGYLGHYQRVKMAIAPLRRGLGDGPLVGTSVHVRMPRRHAMLGSRRRLDSTYVGKAPT
jgi:hypothetical protein